MISANAKRFCLRTERINPFNLISWSSRLQGPLRLCWRTCAHRSTGVPLRPAGLLLSLATDVAKVRRHARIAREEGAEGISEWVGVDGGLDYRSCDGGRSAHIFGAGR